MFVGRTEKTILMRSWPTYSLPIDWGDEDDAYANFCSVVLYVCSV